MISTTVLRVIQRKMIPRSDVQRAFQIAHEHAHERVTLVRFAREALHDHLFERGGKVCVVLARGRRAGSVHLRGQNFRGGLAGKRLMVFVFLIPRLKPGAIVFRRSAAVIRFEVDYPSSRLSC